MGIPFLCFKAQAALFLIPLQAVSHVIPAPQEAGELVSPDEEEERDEAEVKPVLFAGLWGQTSVQQARYGLVLEADGEQRIFLVDDVAGVMELSESDRKALPDEVRSSKNSFITGMIYIEPLDGWGFVIEPAKIFELEGIRR